MKCKVSPAWIKNGDCFFTYESLLLAKVSSISTLESKQPQPLPFFLREKMRVKKITGFLSIRSQHSSANKIQELHTGFEAEDLRQLTQFFFVLFLLYIFVHSEQLWAADREFRGSGCQSYLFPFFLESHLIEDIHSH